MKVIPSERDVGTIPRWARVALTARTLRRLQPLLLVSWPKATKRFQSGVEWGIAEAEAAAAQGSTTPDLKGAGMAAMAVYASRPMNVETAGYLAYAAAHASFGARLLNVSGAHFALEEARRAVYCFEQEHDAPGSQRRAIEAIWADFERLRKASKREKWTDRTPVAPEFFGSMWPKGRPHHWPANTGKPAPVLTRQRRPQPTVAELGLPSELIAFLQAERQLQFDHAQTEVGKVRLKPLHHLRVDDLMATARGTPLEFKDPHRGEDGYYRLRIVDLIGECAAHHPDGLLAWFCDYGVFGSWDCDHHIAIAFPKALWSDIVADPGEYLGAQWDPNQSIATPIVPWLHCDFTRG